MHLRQLQVEKSHRIKGVVRDAVANIHKLCSLQATAENSNITPMVSDPEQVLHGKCESSFNVTFQKSQLAVQERAVIIEAALELNDEGSRSSPT